MIPVDLPQNVGDVSSIDGGAVEIKLRVPRGSVSGDSDDHPVTLQLVGAGWTTEARYNIGVRAEQADAYVVVRGWSPSTSLRDDAGYLDEILSRTVGASLRSQLTRIIRDWRRASTKASVANLPPPALLESDTGGIAIEWGLPDRRFGFAIESDEKESGWYFASSPSSGGFLASGDLSVLEMDSLLRWATRQAPETIQSTA